MEKTAGCGKLYGCGAFLKAEKVIFLGGSFSDFQQGIMIDCFGSDLVKKNRTKVPTPQEWLNFETWEAGADIRNFELKHSIHDTTAELNEELLKCVAA